jgi:hypothetical protein
LCYLEREMLNKKSIKNWIYWKSYSLELVDPASVNIIFELRALLIGLTNAYLRFLGLFKK